MARLRVSFLAASLILLLVFAFDANAVSLTNCNEVSLRTALSNGGYIAVFGESMVVVTNTLVVATNSFLDASGGKLTITGLGATALRVEANVLFTMQQVTVADSLSAFAAGLANFGTSIVQNCTFQRNSATNNVGGAIQNNGYLAVAGSTFASNRAQIGAAILNSGMLVVSETAFRNNLGPTVWAGYLTPSLGATFTNCSFAHNAGFAFVNSPSGNRNGPVTLVNCTIANNSGGLQHFGAFGSQMTVINTAFAGNTNGNSTGPIIDGGHNLSSDNSAGFTNITSRTNLNLLLGQLTNNGGPTLSMAPLPGSPMIDAADSSAAPMFDQRGIPRPLGSASDIGAVEFGIGAGAVGFERRTFMARESDPFVTVSVIRADDGSGPGSVQVQTVPGSAAGNVDYLSTNIVLSFAAGETRKSCEILLQDDSISEGVEQFFVVLTNATGAVTISEMLSGAMVNLADDEPVELGTADAGSFAAAVTNGQSVRFTTNGVLTLSNRLSIVGHVIIDASDYEVTLSGSNATQLFIIEPTATLHLKHLIVSDGLALGAQGIADAPAGQAGQGGGIYNRQGTLIAEDCLFIKNVALGGEGAPGVGGTGRLGIAAGVGGRAAGGAIHNDRGQVHLTNSTFVENSASGGRGGSSEALPQPAFGGPGGDSFGGAIYTLGGTVNVIRCTFDSNSAPSGLPGASCCRTASSGVSAGGALHNAGGAVTFAWTKMTRQSGSAGFASPAYGGALYQMNGSLSLDHCTLSSNAVSGGRGVQNGGFAGSGATSFGGAIAVSAGSLSLVNCSLHENSAMGGMAFGSGFAGDGIGGALFISGVATLTNCTVANNAALGGKSSSAGGSGLGGGLYHQSGHLTLTHATVASNRVARSGIGFGAGRELGSALFITSNAVAGARNTILAHFIGTTNCFGMLTDGGGNISTDASAQFSVSGSLSGIDPKLAPLADYGGPTPTMALLEGSAAIDAALASACAAFDQRDRSRPFGAACDVGAFESSPPWTVHGRIAGFHRPAGVLINFGTNAAIADSSGAYRFEGLSSGMITITPSETSFVHVPHTKTFALSRDIVGIDFRAYLRGAVTPEDETNNTFRVVYAGNPGENIITEIATNLPDWSAFSTNVIDASGVSVVTTPKDGRAKLFRALRR